MVLSRRGLSLHVEQVGTRLLVSLVDWATRRVAASTLIDRIPEDRDAAIATATHVVADLASEVAGRPALPAPATAADGRDRPPPPPPTPATKAPDERAERDEGSARDLDLVDPYQVALAASARERRERAELRFRSAAIGLGDGVAVTISAIPHRVVTGTRRQWYPWQGERKVRLEPAEFYQLVGRADLVAIYRERRALGRALSIGGGAVAAVASIALFYGPEEPGSGVSRAQQLGLAGLGVGLAALAGGWRLLHWTPTISEDEARSLTEQYNTRLRRELGLPITSRARSRELQVAPYVGPRDAGLALATRF